MKINNTMEYINEKTFIHDYLKMCGVTDIFAFLNPTMDNIEPPENYDNMEMGRDILLKSVKDKEIIGILADVDVDGFCSSSLMYNFLTNEIGVSHNNIQMFFHNGKIHGLEDEVVFQEIKESNIKLLIIPDASSSEVDQHKALNDIGIKIIVLDHHTCKVDSKYAVVINNQMSKNVINKNASGTNVTWQFCRYLASKSKKKVDVNKYMDVVAFANLGDVMNMTGVENRTINHFGLTNINNLFIQALIKKFIGDKPVIPKAIVWDCVPKINALIRSDNLDEKIEMFWAFTQTDPEYKFDNDLLILGRAHREQGKLTKALTTNLAQHIQDANLDRNKVIVFSSNEDIGSYTGLVAMKLSEQYGKPVILLKEPQEGKVACVGSLRSPFALQDILSNCNLVNWCSGHPAAAGVSINTYNIPKVVEYLNKLNVDTEPYTDATYTFTARNIPQELFGVADNYNEIWGQGCDKPLWAIKDININGADIEPIGNGATIRFNYSGLTYIMFYQGEEARRKHFVGQDVELRVTVVGELALNEYNGNVMNQVIINKLECVPRELAPEVVEPTGSWQDIF